MRIERIGIRAVAAQQVGEAFAGGVLRRRLPQAAWPPAQTSGCGEDVRVGKWRGHQAARLIFLRCTSRMETAAGVTPATRAAWPTVAGRICASFCRTSFESPATRA